LLRLAVGYSYDEIAAVERVSYTTTNKQITRAKACCASSTTRDDHDGTNSSTCY
jgi:DNA-directed RNA polymerase specialized sigma24 family protein